jgi:hypothetical protein
MNATSKPSAEGVILGYLNKSKLVPLGISDPAFNQSPRHPLGTLHDRWVRTQLNLLGGYDTALTGDVVGESLESE